MDKISLKLNSGYKSLQAGFEWNDIPRFAVITGINGVGKSQLLEVIKGLEQSKNGNRVITREITSTKGVERLIFSDNVSGQGLSLNGLVEYVKNGDQRLASIRDLDRQIGMYKDSVNNLRQQQKLAVDKIERLRLEKNIESLTRQIEKFQNQQLNSIIFAYEEELKRIAKQLNKKIEELTEDEIRKYAVGNFESLTTIDELTRFLAGENQRYMKRVTHLAEMHLNKDLDLLVAEERPYQTINRLFRQYHFDYYNMLNPFPGDEKRNGEILFQGNGGEHIVYDSLSRGEQAIVQFVIWSYGQDFRGNRINTMVLDEPDAHLHSSMCKMMVEIFSELSTEKEIGGGGIRIIITTHSPSTVAFTPEGSLFVMQRDTDNKRFVRPTTSEEAIEIMESMFESLNEVIDELEEIA